MNKKGSDILTGEILYIILLVLALCLIMVVIYSHTNNAASWQDYYSKEIVRIVDASKSGDNVSINVQKGTEIAKKNGLDLLGGELFRFDSKTHEVCVSLSKNSASCYSYFKDLVIVADKQPIEFGLPENWLHFNVVSPTKEGTK